FSWGTLAPVIQVYAVSSSWKLLADFFRNRLKEKALQKAKQESEIKFLRSQINPHFLFNTLNNINSLIRSKPEQAEKSVVRLSNLMRYMLRTGDQPRVPLKDEFDYLLNYIELQKLRLHSDFDLKVVIPESGADLKIEPLLLVSFIENCFKHGVHGESNDFIEISVKLNQNILKLQTRNRIDINSSSREISSGIGLQNVSQRLELCYENKYDLEVVETSGVFEVNLQLQLI
ncbi:MAG: histidine kinase, partial [Crocinitomicaceae bacterium]|nr:histidine kinase [Crocinitomicaceae bacterium]